jgi:hypothetical protein
VLGVGFRENLPTHHSLLVTHHLEKISRSIDLAWITGLRWSSTAGPVDPALRSIAMRWSSGSIAVVAGVSFLLSLPGPAR